MYFIFDPYNGDYLYYSINIPVFIMETGCVYLALGTETLNAIQADFNLESAEG
jgi:hypothetical protein